MSMSRDTLPDLTRALVTSPAFQSRTDMLVPAPDLFALPEKVVQFGTGRFLRGFVDTYIEEANRHGRFGGRVVAVSSTGSGRHDRLKAQDGLFTLAVLGLQDGAPHRELSIVSSVSCALSALDDWERVLACARSPDLELVVSNTTEVGITFDEGDAFSLVPPRSFPGKLTCFLYERARCFEFSPAKGVVVVPCELIEANGDRLRALVLRLAATWRLGERFSGWIEEAVPFCNTLVDRIVPGTPAAGELATSGAELGYQDRLLTTCEPYRLFVIETDEQVAARLPFRTTDLSGEDEVIITTDVTPYRERKVRVLNGAHSLMTPVGLLCGCVTVRDAMMHRNVGPFVRHAVYDEIVPSLDVPGGAAFARRTIERFANPYIAHALRDIALQATTKFRLRVVPSIERCSQQLGHVPSGLAFGFAAHLLLGRPDTRSRLAEHGQLIDLPPDDQSNRLAALWAGVAGDDASIATLVRSACTDEMLWGGGSGTNLTRLQGFVDVVARHLARAVRDGVPAALDAHLAATSAAVAR